MRQSTPNQLLHRTAIRQEDAGSITLLLVCCASRCTHLVPNAVNLEQQAMKLPGSYLAVSAAVRRCLPLSGVRPVTGSGMAQSPASNLNCCLLPAFDATTHARSSGSALASVSCGIGPCMYMGCCAQISSTSVHGDGFQRNVCRLIAWQADIVDIYRGYQVSIVATDHEQALIRMLR